MTSWLRQLATEATPGTIYWSSLRSDEYAFLMSLAPQLALLCADMGDALADYVIHLTDCDPCDCENCTRNVVLLGRLEALQPKDAA